MSHSEVYKWFELYFPQYAGDNVETWSRTERTVFASVRRTIRNLYLRSTTKEIGGLRLLRAS